MKPGLANVMLLACVGGFAAAHCAEPLGNGVKHIGKMTAFWRHRPVVDRWLKGRLGFTRMPEYLCDGALSFPYRKKPAPEEIPFADRLTVVRLLGGWRLDWKHGEVTGERPVEAYDLAYRGEDGRIRYRWELLAPRLDHYVKNGYGLTIVLDNTPWCFPSKPDGRGMGQAAPPADFREWGAFVEQLCRELVKLYGFDTANQWRFRMGTECQGTERFSGTQDQFHKLYDHAAAAVKRVLPDAKFGPFNLAGSPTGHNVSFDALAEHCQAGTNYATGEVGSPLDFASVSIYTAPSILRGILRTTDPTFKAQQKVDFWNALAEHHPELATVSREVHEFGILGNELKVGGGEPGARGAAWTFHVMMCLREGGLDRLWNWGALETINLGRRHRLLRSTGWLLSILEHTVAGETYILEPAITPLAQNAKALPDDAPAIASYRRPLELKRPGRTFYKSIAVVQDKRTFIITSAYNEDRFVTRPADVTVALPQELAKLGDRPRVRQVALTRTNALHYRIRQDLAAAGLLDAKFAAIPGLLGTVKAMAGRPGWRHVDEHWPKYEATIRDSLTLKPFAGSVTSEARHRRFTSRMAPPSVMVIVADNAGNGEAN